VALTAPKPLRADTPGEALPTSQGFWQNFGLGFKSGWEHTTLKLLSDSQILENAQMQKNAGIPKSEWNPENPLYVEGLEWFEGLNYEVVRRAHESLDLSKQMQVAKDNSTGFDGTVGQFTGMLSSAFADPINYVPLPIAKFGSTFLRKAAIVGGVNAGIETSLYPIMKDAYQVRGQEYGIEEAAVNAAFAFGAGAVLYGAFSGLPTAMRAMNFGNSKKTVADQLIASRRNKHSDYDIETTIQDLINNNTVRIKDDGFDNIRDFKFNKTSIENFYVDTSGKIFRNTEDGANITTSKDFIEVVTDLDGTIVLRGPTEGLTKILPTISKGSSTEVKFRIEDTNTQKNISTNREGLDKFANDSAAQIKKTRSQEAAPSFIRKIFKTDTDENLTSLDDLSDLFIVKDTKFEIEPDPVRGINLDENIGKVIRNENGKRTVIVDQDERKAVIETIRKKLTDSGNDPGIDTVKTNKVNDADTQLDENLQPNKQQDVENRLRVVSRIDNTNEVDAGRTPETLENVKTATTTRSQAVTNITEQFDQQQLADLGLTIRDNDLVDIGDIDANLTKSKLDGGAGVNREVILAVKNRLKAEFKKIKDREATETATREYNVCRRT
jgi:hypothetical protein